MQATGSIDSLIGKDEGYFITSPAMPVVAFKLILIVLISIFFNIFSIEAGLWLGELLGNSDYGFFAVTVLYLVSIIVLHLVFQKWIRRRLSHSNYRLIIRKYG